MELGEGVVALRIYGQVVVMHFGVGRAALVPGSFKGYGADPGSWKWSQGSDADETERWRRGIARRELVGLTMVGSFTVALQGEIDEKKMKPP